MGNRRSRIELLQKIRRYIDAEGLATSLDEPQEEIPTLTVTLENDSENRGRTVVITAHELLLPEEEGEKSTDLVRIQLQFYYPFIVKKGASSDVAALLFFLNRQSDFPGLELCAEDMRVGYRYVSINPYSAFSKKLILALVGMVHFFTLIFAAAIEKVALGEQTFNECIDELIFMQQIDRSQQQAKQARLSQPFSF